MTRRGVAVVAGVILPAPPEKYDATDQRETRRLIMLASQQLPQWGAVTSIPAPISALAGLTGAPDTLPYFDTISTMALAALTPYARTILACASAAAARTALDVYSKAETDARSPARANTTITTGALGSLITENSSQAVPFYSGTLITITADRACWVRLYGNATDRTADGTRLVGVQAAAGIGLLAEFVFSGAGTVQVSPIADIGNNDAVRAKAIYYAIQNTSGSTSAVVVTLTVVPVEK